MMFSNFGFPFGDDGLDAIIDGIKKLETNFTVVYVWEFCVFLDSIKVMSRVTSKLSFVLQLS